MCFLLLSINIFILFILILCVILQLYFVWVTNNQKNFEWFTDIIRQVEDNDTASIVETHIFITQLFQHFDLRTTMMVILIIIV